MCGGTRHGRRCWRTSCSWRNSATTQTLPSTSMLNKRSSMDTNTLPPWKPGLVWRHANDALQQVAEAGTALGSGVIGSRSQQASHWVTKLLLWVAVRCCLLFYSLLFDAAAAAPVVKLLVNCITLFARTPVVAYQRCGASSTHSRCGSPNADTTSRLRPPHDQAGVMASIVGCLRAAIRRMTKVRGMPPTEDGEAGQMRIEAWSLRPLLPPDTTRGIEFQWVICEGCSRACGFRACECVRRQLLPWVTNNRHEQRHVTSRVFCHNVGPHCGNITHAMCTTQFTSTP